MTDIKERLRLVAQDPRKATELQALLNDAAAEIERLEDSERILQWVEENHSSEGGGHGFTVFVPIDHEDMRCGILEAIAQQGGKE